MSGTAGFGQLLNHFFLRESFFRTRDREKHIFKEDNFLLIPATHFLYFLCRSFRLKILETGNASVWFVENAINVLTHSLHPSITFQSYGWFPVS